MQRSLSKVIVAVSAFVLGIGAAQAQEEKVLNVYNWSDYIAEDTLAKFTAETGIKVNYDVYDANEILESKLMAGGSGYDVVFPSATPFLANQIKAGIYRKLDKAKLPNWANLDKQVLSTLAVADPGNEFAAAYTVAATGFGYNVGKIRQMMPDAPVDSWSMLFDPKVVAKIKGCGVTLLDSPTEVFPAALLWLGKDPKSMAIDDLNVAAETANHVRANLKYIHSSSYINGLANGDVCLAHGYVGDLVQARQRAKEAGKGVDIVVTIPKEGAQVNIDVMAIPKDAPHPDNAHKFIDFILRPEIIAAITNATGYANAVPAADKLVDPALRGDKAIYPPAEVQAKLFMLPVAPKDYERARTRAWTKVKTRY